MKFFISAFMLDKNDLQAIAELIDAKLERFDSRFEQIDSRFEQIDSRFEKLESSVDELKGDMTNVKSDIFDLKGEVSKINLTLENVINRNIKIIAEGHLDLSRKLDRAMDIEHEKEMMLIRLNILEGELENIKNQLTA